MAGLGWGDGVSGCDRGGGFVWKYGTPLGGGGEEVPGCRGMGVTGWVRFAPASVAVRIGAHWQGLALFGKTGVLLADW